MADVLPDDPGHHRDRLALEDHGRRRGDAQEAGLDDHRLPVCVDQRRAVGPDLLDGVEDRRRRQGQPLAVALDDDRRRLADPRAHLGADVGGALDGGAVDGDQGVTGPDASLVCRGLGVRGRTGGLAAGLAGRHDALVDGGHDRPVLGRLDAVDRHQSRQQDHGDDQVHHRAAQHHHDPLGHRQPVEDALLVPRLDLLEAELASLVGELGEPPGAGDPQGARLVTRARREHADHPDVAPERDRLDAVLGLAAVS